MPNIHKVVAGDGLEELMLQLASEQVELAVEGARSWAAAGGHLGDDGTQYAVQSVGLLDTLMQFHYNNERDGFLSFLNSTDDIADSLRMFSSDSICQALYDLNPPSLASWAGGEDDVVIEVTPNQALDLLEMAGSARG